MFLTKNPLKQLKKHYNQFGIDVRESEGGIKIIFATVNLEDYSTDVGVKKFNTRGDESYYELREIIDSFIYDKKWVKDYEKILFLLDKNPFDFSLKHELYDLGFKYVEIIGEDTNYVEVLAKYCYIDENGKFRLDGELYVDYIGDKFMTLEYMKKWTEQNNFFPTRNRL